MRLIPFVVLRGWRSNRLRTVLSVLGIALGVAVVSAIHIMDHNTIQSRIREKFPDFGRVDLELLPKDPARELLELRALLAARRDVRDVGVMQPAQVTVARDGARAGAPDAAGGRSGDGGPVRLFGLSPLPTAFAHYLVQDGDDLTDLDGDAWVLVSERLAATFGIVVGDALVLGRPSVPPRTRCRNGRLVVEPDAAPPVEPRRVRVKGLLAHARLARRDFGQVVVGSYALARAFRPFDRALFQINRTYGADVDRLRQELSDDFQVLDERSALVGEAADERAFRNGVKVLGGLALVLGMFVVFQTLSQSLVERLRQIGLLRCLGASRSAVASVFLCDALAMAGVGVALGVALGIALAWLLKLLRFSTLGMNKVWEGFELPLEPMAWTALLGVVFTIAGAAFPLWQARNLSAVAILHARGLSGRSGDVLRGVHVFLFGMLALVVPAGYLAMTTLLAESERETLIVLGQLGAMIVVFGVILLLSPRLVQWLGGALLRPMRALWPLSTFLVHKGLDRQGGRFAASVCGLALVLLALLGLKSISWALDGEVQQFGARAMDRTWFVRGDAITPADARRLQSIDGVVAVDPFEGVQQLQFQVSGMALASLVREDGVLEPHPELARRYANERTLLVSPRLARLNRLSVGSPVELVTGDGPKSYRVLAVTDRAGFFPDERAWAITDPRWMREDFCVAPLCVQRIALRMARGVEPDAVLAAARSMFPHLGWAKHGDELVAYLLRDRARDFLLFDVLLALILGLAGLGLVNAMTIAAMGRVREIGVMRALGMSVRQLRTGFRIEGLCVGAIAALIALSLGAPLGLLVVTGLNRVAGLDAPYVLPWPYFVIVPFVAVAVGVAAAVVPGSRAARMSPAQAVRYE